MLDFYLFVLALIPILSFIALGFFFKYINFLPDSGWQAVEKLIYYLLFPALLIHSIGKINYDISAYLPMAAALNIAVLIMFCISFFAWQDKTVTGPRFSSILQNNIRFNSFIALGLATEYQNGHFLPLVAIGVGMLIPTINIISVWSLIIWGRASKDDSPIEHLFKNPLIIGCVIGFMIHFFKIELPEIILEPVELLGQTAMPLALIAVGTGIDYKYMREHTSSRLLWALVRNLGFPIATLISCYIFGIKDQNIILAAIIIAAAPTATNSYILARQMGGDAPFMASLIGTSTLISSVTVPFIMYAILLFMDL